MTAPDPLARVRAIDAELVSLYARVEALLRERARVLSRSAPPTGAWTPGPAAGAGWPAGSPWAGGVVAGAGGPAGSPWAGGFGGVGWTGGPAAGSTVGRVPGLGGDRPGREARPLTVQALLLALGGLLLGTAAVVFTVVAWSRAGLAGRALVLAVLTAAALAAPALLLRRRLAATAETVAAVGLLLCLLDAYAVRRLDVAGLGSVDGGTYVAGVLALLAAGCAGYAALLPLRGPRPTAVVLAQLPLPLLALSAGASPAGLALALLGGPTLDLALSRYATSAGVHRAAALTGTTGWGLAVLVAGAAAFAAAGVPVAAAGVLVLAGLLALAAATGPVGTTGPGTTGPGTAGPGTTGPSTAGPGTAGPGTAGRVGVAGRLVLCLSGWGRALAARPDRSRSDTGVGLGVLVLATAAISVGRVPLEAAVTGAGVPLAAAVVGLLAALAAAALPVRGRRGPLGAAGTLLVLTATAPLATAVAALGVPLAVVAAPWRGVPEPVPAAMEPGVALAVTALVTAGLTVAALAAEPLLRRASPALTSTPGAGGVPAADPPAPATPAPHPTAAGTPVAGRPTPHPPASETPAPGRPVPLRPTGGRPVAGGPAAGGGWGLAGGVLTAGGLAMVVLAPVALGLTLAGTLALLGGLTAGAAVLAARAGRTGPIGAIAAAALAALTVGYALAAETGTLAVLAALALVAAAVAGLAASRPVRTGAAAVAVLALAGEAAAAPLAAGSTVRPAGFLLLGVAAAAVATAAVLRRTAPAEALAVELAAAPVATAGVALAATEGWSASAAFGVLGLILAAAALRPDRRLLAYPAAASVQLAGWIALATAEVDVPEAYTVPLSLALLTIGLLRRRTSALPHPTGQSTSRRGSTTLSSWLAYGPALTVTAGPSLAAALAGGTDLRPLLLGAAAVATVLVGARARLQAPLAVGTAVLGVLALHELGPALVGLTADLPRWLPPALGGALLLAVGSTYERRLADLRRARSAFARLG